MINPNDAKTAPLIRADESILGMQRDAQLRQRLYRIVTGLMLVYSLILSGSAYSAEQVVPMPLYVVVFAMVAFNILGYIKGVHRWAAPVFIGFMWVYVTGSGFSGFGPNTYVLTAYLLVILLSNGLLNAIWTTIIGVASLLLMVLFLNLDMSNVAFMQPSTIQLANRVGGTANVIIASLLVIVQTRSTERTLGRTQSFANALDIRNHGLEADVEMLNIELDQREHYLQATSAIAKDAAAVLTEEEMVMDQVVRTVSEQMRFYHAGLFLIEEDNTWAVLRAASSQGGQAMLARGHRLRVGSQGLVGYVAQTGRYRIAGDVSADAVFFNNPDLPETNSEIALPLVVRGRTFGVLDVQSEVAGAFSQDDVQALQTLADQVAVAVYSAEMLATTQEQAEQALITREQSTAQFWKMLLNQGENLTYISTGKEAETSEPLARPEMRASYTQGATVVEQSADAPDSVAIPIRVRGEVVGVINARQKDAERTWSEEDIALMESLSDQLNIALEGAQLYEDSQRRATRERLVREVTDQMRSAVTWEELLQTAVQQMADTVQVPRAYVHWSVNDDRASGSLEEPAKEASNA